MILGHMALTKIKRIPITARDQSMVESGETEGGKNAASFLFRERTVNGQRHKHEASS